MALRLEATPLCSRFGFALENLNNYVGARIARPWAMCPQWWQALYELVRTPYTDCALPL